MDRIPEEDLLKMTMDFYDDIDVDFGNKTSFAELLKIAEGEGDCGSKNEEPRADKKISTEVVLPHEMEDQVEEEEYLYRNFEYYNDLNEDISQEVLEVNGDNFHNEPLEERYKKNNPVAIKPARKSKSSKKVPSAGANKILNKSELRKEMLGGDALSSDSKVVFQKKKNNAFLNSLDNTPATVDSESEDIPEPIMNPVKRERTLKWIMELNSSEEEYYSAKSSTSNYLTASASASDNDTPRKYRATSQRYKKKTALVTNTNESDVFNVSATSNSVSSKSPPTSDESVGFKSTSVTPVKSPPKKTAKKKKTVSTYRPMLYKQDFKFDQNEFPPI